MIANNEIADKTINSFFNLLDLYSALISWVPGIMLTPI